MIEEHHRESDWIRWHINRYDGLRASTASRAAIILSASTILLAGVAIVVSQFSEHAHPYAITATFVVLLTTLVGCVVLCMYHCIQAIVSTIPGRELFGPMPDRGIFSHSDVAHNIADFREFRAFAIEQDEEFVRTSALSELWLGILQHNHRYQHLRSSTRYFRASLIGLLAVVGWAIVGAINVS